MKLAIFDFDGTLFPHETLPFLLKQWKIQKYSRARLYYVYMVIGGMYIWYKLGFGRKHREYMRKVAIQKFTRIFAGMTKEQIDIFFETCAVEIIAQLNDNIVKEIKKTKAAGFHTVILSGCYDDLLEYISSALDVDTIIGTTLFYENDVINTRKELMVCGGSGKAKKIQSVFADKDIDCNASTAYADSILDMSILELVGNPVAVYPDEELAKIAAQKKWRVIK